jgi:hypothetical protein
MKMDVALALTVILNAVKDLLYVLIPSKQITSRFFVAGLLRMTLRQVPRAMGGKPTPSQIFEGVHEEHEVNKSENINFRSFVSFVLLCL